jgi:cation transporter-like permease
MCMFVCVYGVYLLYYVGAIGIRFSFLILYSSGFLKIYIKLCVVTLCYFCMVMCVSWSLTFVGCRRVVDGVSRVSDV